MCPCSEVLVTVTHPQQEAFAPVQPAPSCQEPSWLAHGAPGTTTIVLFPLPGLFSRHPPVWLCLGWRGMAGEGASHREQSHDYLDGGGAPLLVLALTQKAVGLHIIPWHWHWLHNMQAVAATQRTQDQQQAKLKAMLCGSTLG